MWWDAASTALAPLATPRAQRQGIVRDAPERGGRMRRVAHNPSTRGGVPRLARLRRYTDLASVCRPITARPRPMSSASTSQRLLRESPDFRTARRAITARVTM